MANTQPIPTQVADAPASNFRAPFFEINPNAGPNAGHATAHSQGAAIRASIFDINPTAGPAPSHAAPSHAEPSHAAPPPVHAAAACPPAPGTMGASPLEIHEPAPGQHVEVTVLPNQPLVLDFNPLDAQAVLHGNDLTLTFADGGVVVLHDITEHGVPLPTPLQLPDGTIINPCELLQALPGEQANPAAGLNEKIPLEQINPAAGPTPIIAPAAGGHPVVTQFALPGLGNGLTPLGPLSPIGFSTTTAFPPPGNGGFPPTPPGPPGPPGTPGFLVTIEDSNLGVVPNLVDNPAQTTLTITGNFLTDYVNSGGIHGVDGSPTPTFSNGVSVNTGTATGEFGTLAVTADGTYTYTVDVAGQAAVNQLGSDRLSEALNQQYSGATPYLAPLEDEFVVTVSNGTTTQSELLALYIEGADATKTMTAVTGSASSTLLLTYTDLYDPAHSFSELVTVNAAANQLVTDAPIQPGDPALVSLYLESGSPVTINSIEVAGGTITVPGQTLDNTDHSLTAMIDPQVTTGTTYSVLDGPHAWTDVAAGGSATQLDQYLYADGNAVTLNVLSGSAADIGTDPQHPGGVVLNLGSFSAGTGIEQGGLGSDTLVWNPGAGTSTTYYNGMAGAVVSGTPTAGDTLNLIFTNAGLVSGGHPSDTETISITVTAGETTSQMAQALANAINADAALTTLNGGNPLADWGGGNTFQFTEDPGSAAFGHTQYSEFALPAVLGNTASENVSGSDGLDTLSVQNANQTLDFSSGSIHAANIDVIQLGTTDNAALAGNVVGGDTLTLTPDSVLQLTQNETTTITSFSGGANAIWITGNSTDTVNLNGFVSGSNPNPMISGAVTSGTQDPIPNVLPATAPTVPGGVDVNGVAVTTAPTSPTQMVGFTEFSGTTSSGNVVHVYVENAIATSGHVHVH